MKKQYVKLFIIRILLLSLLLSLAACGNSPVPSDDSKQVSEDSTTAVPPVNQETVLDKFRVEVRNIECDDRIHTVLYTDNGEPVIEMGAGSTAFDIRYDPHYFDLYAEDGSAVPYISGKEAALNMYITAAQYSTPLDLVFFRLDFTRYGISKPGHYKAVIPIQENHVDKTIELSVEILEEKEALQPAAPSENSLVPEECAYIVIKNADIYTAFNTYKVSREDNKAFFEQLCKIFTNADRQMDFSGEYGAGKLCDHERARKFVFYDARGNWLNELYYYGEVLEYQGNIYKAEAELAHQYFLWVTSAKLKDCILYDAEKP